MSVCMTWSWRKQTSQSAVCGNHWDVNYKEKQLLIFESKFYLVHFPLLWEVHQISLNLIVFCTFYKLF